MKSFLDFPFVLTFGCRILSCFPGPDDEVLRWGSLISDRPGVRGPRDSRVFVVARESTDPLLLIPLPLAVGLALESIVGLVPIGEVGDEVRGFDFLNLEKNPFLLLVEFVVVEEAIDTFLSLTNSSALPSLGRPFPRLLEPVEFFPLGPSRRVA